MSILRQIIDIFFPENCLLCEAAGTLLCPVCLSLLTPFSQEQNKLAGFIHPVLSYKDPNVKKIIWAFKYNHKKQLAACLAKTIEDSLLETVSELELLYGLKQVLLVPIPLHKSRKNEREYNQAELLVEALVDDSQSELLKPKYNLLIRTTFFSANAKSRSKAERFKNIAGSFRVLGEESVLGATIILIDDVVTTGATLSEARKVLLSAGARRVLAITLAH